MADKPPQKVFVKEDNSARIRCETCGLVRKVRVQNVASHAPVVRIRCTCTAVFPVQFEHRKSYRKVVNLEGTYRVLLDEESIIPDLSQARKATSCRIENISMYGAGFSVLGRHRIDKDARIILGFTLDDSNRTWIQKTGVVRRVDGSYIGLKFDEEASPDRALGFYLML